MSARGWARAALLAGAFLVVIPDAGRGDLVLAGAAAALALSSSGRPAAPRARIRRGALLVLPGLAWDLSADIVRGTWRVGQMVLGVRRWPRPGLVEIPLGDRSATEAAVLGLLVTLAPGSVLVTIDDRRGVLVFHAVGFEADAFAASVARLSERHLKRIFERGDP